MSFVAPNEVSSIPHKAQPQASLPMQLTKLFFEPHDPTVVGTLDTVPLEIARFILTGTGYAVITVTGDIGNNRPDCGASVGLACNINGMKLTPVGRPVRVVNPESSHTIRVPFTLHVMVQLNTNVENRLDLLVSTIRGGVASITNLTVTIQEF